MKNYLSGDTLYDIVDSIYSSCVSVCVYVLPIMAHWKLQMQHRSIDYADVAPLSYEPRHCSLTQLI